MPRHEKPSATDDLPREHLGKTHIPDSQQRDASAGVLDFHLRGPIERPSISHQPHTALGQVLGLEEQGTIEWNGEREPDRAEGNGLVRVEWRDHHGRQVWMHSGSPSGEIVSRRTSGGRHHETIPGEFIKEHPVEKDAEANASADKERRELVEAKNNAEAMVHSTEKQLAEHGDKVDASVKGEIEAAMEDLKTAAEGENLEDIQAKTQALMQASMKLGEAIYAAAQDEGEAAAQADAAKDASDDDDVIDADFEDVGDDKKSA